MASRSINIKTPFVSIEHKDLVASIAPWWVANGWNPDTLKIMPYKQVLAIAVRAAKDGWPVKQHAPQVGEQRPSWRDAVHVPKKKQRRNRLPQNVSQTQLI